MDLFRRAHLCRVCPRRHFDCSAASLSRSTTPRSTLAARARQESLGDLIELELPGTRALILQQIAELNCAASPVVFEYLLACQTDTAALELIIYYLAQYPQLRAEWLRCYPLEDSSLQVFAYFLDDYNFAAEVVRNAAALFAETRDCVLALNLLRQAMAQIQDMLRAAGVGATLEFTLLRNCCQKHRRAPLGEEEQTLVYYIFDDFGVLV